MLVLLLAFAVFLSAAAGDVVEAYFVRAVHDMNPHRAAQFSCAMWAVSLVGWAVVVRVSWWYLVPEVCGLYAGSWLAITRQRASAGM